MIDNMIRAAIDEGILPPGASISNEHERPWPVILLTALGAWLAILPLIFFITLLLSGDIARGLAGLIVLTGAATLLRNKALPLFVEQMSLPALVAGAGLLAVSMSDTMPDTTVAGMLAVLTCILAFAIDRAWLRVLFGAAACALSMLAIMEGHLADDTLLGWLALHGALAVWLIAQCVPENRLLATMSTGWAVVVLAGMAMWSGMTFLVGGSVGLQGHLYSHAMSEPWGTIASLTSSALAAASALWIARQWPSLRVWWAGLVALVMVALSWPMPALGGVLMILSVCVGFKSWRIAMGAGIAAAWVIGAFYYAAAVPLATKAIWMVLAGALLGGIAWSVVGLRSRVASAAMPRPHRAQLAGIGLTAVLAVVVANVAIWQKETLIERGRPIFVELGPVDPRSLMQGDYMQLAFLLPDGIRDQSPRQRSAKRAHAVGKIDQRGIARFVRIDTGAPLASDEIAVELTPGQRGWTVVTDAWYFKEGEGERWARARYGEFRVDDKGRALLVGMRGPALEPL